MIVLEIDLKSDTISDVMLGTILEINLKSDTISDVTLGTNDILVNLVEKGDTPRKGVDYMTVEDINEIKEGLQLDVEIEAATIEEIQRLF